MGREDADRSPWRLFLILFLAKRDCISLIFRFDMHDAFLKALVISVLVVIASIPVRAAESFVVADSQTGHVLQSDKENRKLPIGSLAQLATALVALDWMRQTNQSSSTVVTVTSSSADSVKSTVSLQPGDSISLRDLLYCVILASDQVAANTLADYIGLRLPANGLTGKESFVSQMNALARQLGMTRTLFLNPDGSDRRGGRQPYSTAADVARLVRYAFARADYPFYVNQVSRVISLNRTGNPLSFRIRNTNTLLGNNRIDGAKIGFSPRAGQCLALTADRPSQTVRQGNVFLVAPRRLIIVLLGSSNGFSEGLALLQQGWTLYDQWVAAGRPIQERSAL